MGYVGLGYSRRGRLTELRFWRFIPEKVAMRSGVWPPGELENDGRILYSQRIITVHSLSNLLPKFPGASGAQRPLILSI